MKIEAAAKAELEEVSKRLKLAQAKARKTTVERAKEELSVAKEALVESSQREKDKARQALITRGRGGCCDEECARLASLLWADGVPDVAGQQCAVRPLLRIERHNSAHAHVSRSKSTTSCGGTAWGWTSFTCT